MAVLGNASRPPNVLAVASLALLVLPPFFGLLLAQQQGEKRRMASAAEQQHLNDLLLAELPAAVLLRRVYPDGRSVVSSFGGNFEEVLGWSVEEVLAAGGARFLAVPGSGPVTVSDPRLLREGRLTHEWQILRRDGRVSWVRSHLRVIRLLPDGGYDVVRHTINIDAERDAQDRALAAERLATLGTAAAGIAHELKQPLAVLRMAAELIAEAASAGNLGMVQEWAGRVEVQAGRMGQVIETVQRFARGAEASAVAAPTELGEVIQATLALAGPALKEAGMAVEVAPGVVWPCVMAGPVPLQQVLLNLLRNARDAMAGRPAELPRRIRLAPAAAPGGQAALAVSDTGGGIAAEMLPRLFERFATSKPAGVGLGLGLALSRDILLAFGGTLTAANNAEGAVFTLCLPLAEATEQVAA